MPKKQTGRKVTNADLFAPVHVEQPEQRPPPLARPVPPGQQIQIPKEGEFNVKVRPEMAPPGIPQQTMLPISPGPGSPPVAVVPIVFVLPQGAQPGMEIKVPFKVIGPPQPLPQQPLQPQRMSAVPSPAPPPSQSPAPAPEPEPEPVPPPSDVTAVLAEDQGEVRIVWTPPKLPGQQLNDGKVMPELPAPCRVEYRGAVWPPDLSEALSQSSSPPGKKKQASQQKGQKNKNVGSSDEYRALPASAAVCADSPHQVVLPLSELQPGACYAFRVIASRQDGSGESCSEVAEVTAPSTLPMALAPPTFGSVARTSFKCKWRKPAFDGGAQITAYCLEVHRAGEKVAIPIPVATYEGTDTEFKVSGLLPGEPYSCKVRACNSHGWNEWSEPSMCYAKAGVPSVPADLRLAAATDRTLELAWDEPGNDGGSPVTGYKVEMDKGDGRGMWPADNPSSASFEAQGLAPGTTYSFRVCAINLEGASPWTQVAEFSTTARRAAPPKDAPRIVNKPGRTSVNLQWSETPDPGGAAVLGYVVTVLRTGKDVPRGWKLSVETRGPDATYACVEGLSPGLKYVASVQVRNTAGLGSAGEKVKWTSKADRPGVMAAPRLSPAGKTPGALRVDWDTVEDHGAPITAYTLEQAGPVPHADLTAPWITVYSGQELKFSASALLPGGSYAYRLRATNAEGTGEWSQEATIKIGAAVPGVPAPPVVTASSAKSISVSWESAAAHGSPVIGHQLQLRLCKGDEKWRTVFNAPSPEQRSFVIENQPGAAAILVPASEYELRVASVNEVGLGPYSACSTTVTGATVPIAPAAPVLELLKLTPKDNEFEHSVRVSWKPPINTGGSMIVSYVVEMDDGAGGAFEEIGWGPTTLGQAVEVIDLLPGREYKARVQAVNAIGVGKFSVAGTVKTGWPAPSVAPVFAAVRENHECEDVDEEEEDDHVSLRGCKPSQQHQEDDDDVWCGVTNGREMFALAWSQEPDFEAELFGGAPPLRFALEMSADSTEWSSVYKGEQCTAMVPLAPLLPFARYVFRVRATSSGGNGPWSELLTLTTPAWRPGVVKVKSVQTDSCELNWSRPPRCERASIVDNNDPWCVKMSIVAMRDCSIGGNDEPAELGEGEIVHVETREVYKVVYRGGSKKTVVEGLSPGTEYQFFIATPVNEGGLQGAIASCTTALEQEVEETEEQEQDTENTSEEDGADEEGVEGSTETVDIHQAETDGGTCVVC